MYMVQLLITQLEEDIRQAHNDHPPPTDCPKDHMFILKDNVELKLYHKSWLLCHPGINKTLVVVKAQFWWKNLVKDVKEFISSCHQYSHPKPRDDLLLVYCDHSPSCPGPGLTPLDFITWLPSSGGNTVIFNILDRFSWDYSSCPLKETPICQGTGGGPGPRGILPPWSACWHCLRSGPPVHFSFLEGFILSSGHFCQFLFWFSSTDWWTK